MLTAKGRKPKPPTARDRQRHETERRLLAAARKLFSDYGYQNTAITEIAKVAGVTHALIHAYFNSKAGLLYALVSETNARQDKRVAEVVGEPGTLRERLRRIVTVWAEHMMALVPARNEPSSTRCTPWLGAISRSSAGSSICRMSSEKMPVALTTTRASSSYSLPASMSRARTPQTRPPRFLNSVTFT